MAYPTLVSHEMTEVHRTMDRPRLTVERTKGGSLPVADDGPDRPVRRDLEVLHEVLFLELPVDERRAPDLEAPTPDAPVLAGDDSRGGRPIHGFDIPHAVVHDLVHTRFDLLGEDECDHLPAPVGQGASLDGRHGRGRDDVEMSV